MVVVSPLPFAHVFPDVEDKGLFSCRRRRRGYRRGNHDLRHALELGQSVLPRAVGRVGRVGVMVMMSTVGVEGGGERRQPGTAVCSGGMRDGRVGRKDS